MLPHIPESILSTNEHHLRIASWITYIEEAVVPKAFKEKCPIVMMNDYDPSILGDRIDKLVTYAPVVARDIYQWSEAYFLWLGQIEGFADGFLSTNLEGSCDADLNSSLFAISIVAVRYRYLSYLDSGVRKYRTLSHLNDEDRNALLKHKDIWRFAHKIKNAKPHEVESHIHELDVRITVGLLDHELELGVPLEQAITKSVLNTAQ